MEERIAKRIDAEGDCWLWTGQLDRAGYGRLGIRAAHRLVYEVLVGPIPEGLQIDHLCRVHACVNPDHLEPVTQTENQRRGFGVWKLRMQATTCRHGHAFDAKNTYYRAGITTLQRVCRACNREKSRRYADRKRAAIAGATAA